jgi:hypothetical protein
MVMSRKCLKELGCRATPLELLVPADQWGNILFEHDEVASPCVPVSFKRNSLLNIERTKN